MGNIFSYYFGSNKFKYGDSLLDPLNQEDEEIQYASLLDIESINGQVGILEQTTQSSLKNISTDVKYLFDEIVILKNQYESLYKQLEISNTAQSNTAQSNTVQAPLINLNTGETSVYLDAPNNRQAGSSSSEETY